MNTTEKTAVVRLVEKVERAGVVAMQKAEWRELATLAAECRALVEVPESGEVAELREALGQIQSLAYSCENAEDTATKNAIAQRIFGLAYQGPKAVQP